MSWHLQDCRPRLSRLRTNGFAPAGKYWTYRSHDDVYGPSKPSSWSSIGVSLTPPTSLVGSGEKLLTDPRIDQPACCGLCREPFFSGAMRSVQIYRRLTKCCYMWTTWDTYGPRPYMDWAWEACSVLVRFSPAGSTSIQIITTLRYE
jgi:hypothetical protein